MAEGGGIGVAEGEGRCGEGGAFSGEWRRSGPDGVFWGRSGPFGAIRFARLPFIGPFK